MQSCDNGSEKECCLILPIEIWDYILKYIPKTSLLAAAEVCTSWRLLAYRICKKYCLENIHERLLDELSDIVNTSIKADEIERENDPNFWLELVRLYEQSRISRTHKGHVLLTENKNLKLEDPFLLYWEHEASFSIVKLLHMSGKGNLRSGSLPASLPPEEEWLTFKTNPQIFKVIVLRISHPILLFFSSSDVSAFLFEKNSQEGIKSLRISPPDIIFHQRNIVIANKNWVLTTTEQGNILHLYETSLNTPSAVLRFHIMSIIEIRGPVYHLGLWKDWITTVECSGYIRTYHVKVPSTMLVTSEEERSCILKAETEFLIDLAYPSPVHLSQDLIFVNTATSSSMLGYWHMDRDMNYVIISNTVPKCIEKENYSENTYLQKLCLHRVKIGPPPCSYKVSVVHYQRGHIFFGTVDGDILIYKCFYDKCDEDQSLKLSKLQELPWLCLNFLRNEAIVRLSVLFINEGVLILIGYTNHSLLVHVPRSL